MCSLSIPKLLLLCIAVDATLAFVSPSFAVGKRLTPSERSILNEVQWRYETSLQMGIRSFVKNRILNRIGGDSDSTYNEYKEPAIPDFTTLNYINDEETENETTSVDVINDNNNNNDIRPSFPGRPETPQERIQRVKSGKMTDEEKKAFVNVALSAGDVKHRKPLRQSLPSDIDEISRSRRRPSASKESIRDAIFGRNKDIDPLAASQAMAAKAKMDIQKKKRDYLDMVTDPNRFNRYKAGPHPDETTENADIEPSETEVPVTSTNEPVLAPDEELIEAEAVSMNAPTVAPIPVSNPLLDLAGQFNTPTALGIRLEAAAVADEERRQAMRIQVQQQRMEEDRRLAEVRRLREEEQFIREAEASARKKEEIAAAARAADEMRREEAVRQQALIDAQDEYWKNKLGKAVPASPVLVQDGAVITEDGTEDGEVIDAAASVLLERPDPIIDDKDALLSGLNSLNDVKRITNPSVGSRTGQAKSTYMTEQMRKKAEIDKAKDIQLQQLRALNSPLPVSRPAGLSPSITPARKVPPSQMPLRSVAPRPAQNNRSSQSVSPPPAPVAKSGEANMSIKEIMRQRAIDATGKASPVPAPPPPPATSSGRPAFPPPPPPSSATPVSPPSPAKENTNSNNGGALGALGRLLGGPGPGPASSTSPKRKVRQELPVAGDDDDDFDAFSRNGAKKGMSIADAMSAKDARPTDKGEQKERSKMWGIDISKYVKD